MSVFSHVDGLGPQLEEALADSVLAWRNEFRRKHQDADVIAEQLRSVGSELSLFAGGYASVVVTIYARRKHQDAVYVFRFNRIGSGTWKRSGDSLP